MDKTIIKTGDSSINVEQIMQNISKKAKEINPEDIDTEVKLLEKYGYELETEISPFILQTIKKPKSGKTGFISKISNLIIRKIYYVMWNSIGDTLTKQQQINKALLRRVKQLESDIEKLKSNK